MAETTKTSEICDLSDLPIGQCACRIHGPKVDPQELGFIARYDGECAGCGLAFEEGERIANLGGGYGHVQCQY